MQYNPVSYVQYPVLQYIGKVGTVHRITERGDVRVQYDGCSNRWTFHPGALKKVKLWLIKLVLQTVEKCCCFLGGK